MKPNRNILPLVVFAVFVAVVLFLFRLPVSHLLENTIVKFLFVEFEPSFWADVFLMAIIIVLMIWAVTTQPLRFLFRVTLFCTIFYGFQRINSFWVFAYTKSLPALAYWDVIFIALLIQLALAYIYSLKSEEEDDIAYIHQGFIEDSEINSFEMDAFRRRATASEIARLIVQTKNRRSFAIGVLGEYGSGKTSFLNLINLELSDEDVLKISFNPWSVSSPEAIRSDFFDLLAAEVADIDRKISSLIYSYSRKLSNFNSQSVSFLNWFAFLRTTATSQDVNEYTQINNMLRKAGRKIVVSIDDLDRLDSAEIMEVLKLIRNTADFSNVFYLVGYDKGYVKKAIGEQNYLDKIFQMEIPLPKCEEDDLLMKLQVYLKVIISVEHYSIFENVMIPNGFRSRYEKAYKGMLRQGRDVVRFLNGFKVVYGLIGEEVDFECLMLLELIKFRFPQIYDLIYTQSDLFLYEIPVRSTHEQYLIPRLTITANSNDEISVFRSHIEKFDELAGEDVSLLDGLFKKLFNGREFHKPEAKNSISYPLYFEVFFRFRLGQKDISDKDFKAAIHANKMISFMNYCANNDLHKELMTRLLQEDVSKDRRHFERVISWIFSFGKTFVDKEGMFRFDNQALIDKIFDYHDELKIKMYKNDTNAYARFLRPLFRDAVAPYLFENEVIYHLKKKGDKFILQKKELTFYQHTYFMEMADSGHGLSKSTLQIFWGARQYYQVHIDDSGAYKEEWNFEPELVSKMKSYLTSKDPTQFLKFSIEHNMYEGSQALISKYVRNMFDDISEYREIISENRFLEDDVKQEYLELFDKLAEKNFNEYVEFEFKTVLRKDNDN